MTMLLALTGLIAGCATPSASPPPVAKIHHANVIIMEDKDLVPDEATAIKIASAVMEGYLGTKRFKQFLQIRALAAVLEGDDWLVCHCRGMGEEYADTGDSIIIPQGLGLEMAISRKTGEIKHIGPAHGSEPR